MAVIPAFVRQGRRKKICKPLSFHSKDDIIYQVRESHFSRINFSSVVTEASKIRDKARSDMAVEIVENMLRSGMTPEEIFDSCKLALSDIIIVQKRMMQTV